MSKKFIVNKKDFCNNFLGSIVDFKVDTEFVTIHYVDGYLVYFSNVMFQSGSIFLFCKHKPENCNFEEGETFHLKFPQKIKKLVETFDGDRLAFGLTEDQIISKGKGSSFRFKLYDKKLAENSKEFLKPENFFNIEKDFKEGQVISKEKLKQIKVACSMFEDKKVTLVSDGSLDIVIGEKESNTFRLTISDESTFANDISFIKDLFLVLKPKDFDICENEEGKIVCVKETDMETEKYFMTVKVRD